ncbi:hypothetical protein JQX13_52910 [Archangium violaceum]|uniref:hypothetical protein n=1 Tax=Archangium violaceum TaxID=83451 RepID=UPI00193B9C87|nr:hypothetical protein [Archangium violaceum]QRK08511.1 hypothetical protein JQX13_52910 [Archangium violaceum]
MRPALALLLLLATPALAQEGASSTTSTASKDKDTKKKKVIRLDAITVEGHIQKPQAFYVLSRSNLNFDELNKAESFTPKVVKSVEKEPF